MPAKKLTAKETAKAKGQKASAKAKPTRAKTESTTKATKAKSAPKTSKATSLKTKTPRTKATPKVKVTAKSIREATTTRITWNPQPVEGAKWYVLQTQSNYEKRVQLLIREQVLIQGMQRFVEDVLIPMEPVIEVKKGIKVSTDRKFFPGYVLLKCNMTDDVWHLVRHTPHVSGFMGADRGRKPLPIMASEAERILNQMEHGAGKPKNLVNFEMGENVRVTEGPFANFQGVVDGVDEEKERLTVSVSIFGRATPIELDFAQVEKA